MIEFPQVFDPKVYQNAIAIFQRYNSRLCEFFHSRGVPIDPLNLADDLWQNHGYPRRAPVDPRLMAPDYRD